MAQDEQSGPGRPSTTRTLCESHRRFRLPTPTPGAPRSRRGCRRPGSDRYRDAGTDPCRRPHRHRSRSPSRSQAPGARSCRCRRTALGGPRTGSAPRRRPPAHLRSGRRGRRCAWAPRWPWPRGGRPGGGPSPRRPRDRTTERIPPRVRERQLHCPRAPWSPRAAAGRSRCAPRSHRSRGARPSRRRRRGEHPRSSTGPCPREGRSRRHPPDGTRTRRRTTSMLQDVDAAQHVGRSLAGLHSQSSSRTSSVVLPTGTCSPARRISTRA